MKKPLLFTLPLIFSSLGAISQVDLRTSDLIRLSSISTESSLPSRVRKTPKDADKKVEMIVRYDSEETLKEMEKSGAEIISLVGTRTAIVAAAPGQLTGVAQCKGVTGAMLSAPVKRANNKALPASGVDAVRNGLNLPVAYDGKDIVIGLFDVGIDPNHINFRDDEGNSRIKRVWHYPGQTAKPDIYDTPEKISSFDSDTNSESHGTHVLGIMSGSFVDTSKSGAPDYRGVAPGAEIVAACGAGYNVQILDAIEKIGAYAQSQRKPCVINLSFGDNVGPHDGTDEFTEAINDVAAKYNAVICLAGGNEADQKIAIVKTLPEENPVLSTLLVKNNNDIGGNFQVYGPIEIWTTDNTPFEVTLDIISRSTPDEPVYSFEVPEKKETYVAQGNNINQYLNTGKMDLITSGTEFHNLYTNSFMGGIRGKDNYNGRYRASMNFYIEGRTSSVISRNSVKVSVKGKPGQKIFMYTDGYYMEFGNRNIPGLDIPDGYGTNSNMAAGEETFAVGSYVTNNVTGSGYPNQPVGDISFFSSYGETLDGRIMPDVAAPGQVIISSRNTLMPTSSTYAAYYPVNYSYTDTKRKKTYNWTCCAGTSQASPHAAGVMALIRQANPQLSHKEVYDIVRKTADKVDDNTTVWGHGKLNAFEAVKTALSLSSVDDIIDRGAETILIENSGNIFEIFAPGESDLRAEIYSIAGMKLQSENAAGENLKIDASGLSSGVYILHIRGSRSEKTIKVRL
ncbi:MAG: S8 family peptidase [Muribaculaceae bacterium]|nr:S8 family peptidase [Muribaculaceae bacterium]